MGLKVDSGPTAVSDLLAGGALGKLAARAREQRSILEEVRSAAGTGETAKHIVAARVDGHTLIIVADSGAWCSRLRWSTYPFDDVARRHGATRCRFKVLPNPSHTIPYRPG